MLNVHALVFHFRTEDFPGRQKSVHAVRSIPGIGVNGQDAVRPAPLAFKREITVPRADVQNRPAIQVLGDLHQLEASLEPAAYMPLSPHDAVSQVDGMRPANPFDSFLNFFRAVVCHAIEPQKPYFAEFGMRESIRGLKGRSNHASCERKNKTSAR